MFLIDHVNKVYTINSLVPEDRRIENGKEIVQRRHYDSSTRRIEKTIIIKNGRSSSTYRESIRLYDLEEFVEMVKQAGLNVTSVLGGLDGRPFGPGEARMVVIGERTDAAN